MKLGKVLDSNNLENEFRDHGAGEGNRTPVSSLGSYCSTIELHPR
jgi:hypothetical protein